VLTSWEIAVQFSYDRAILEIAPTLVAGIIWCQKIDNTKRSPEIEALLEQARVDAIERFPANADIARDPAIAAWREIYSKLGLTPNRYPCAAESLIRRAVSGSAMPNISPLVDLCNAVSLDHAIPVAPFDLRLVEGDSIVRLATGDEVHRSIGSSELQPIPCGEAIYADETLEVLSRRWNWRQTGKGAIQPSTTNILITTEAVHVDGRATVESALSDLTEGIRKFLGGAFASAILSAKEPFNHEPESG
jgi:DNA/RNA-binding domain of Phe-tRNA-synthetase-like protein